MAARRVLRNFSLTQGTSRRSAVGPIASSSSASVPNFLPTSFSTCASSSAPTWANTCSGGACAGTSYSCDDGDVCNGDETCNASAVCQPGVPLPVDDDNECTIDACIEGICDNPVANDGFFCGDGYCQSGVCEPLTSLYSCNEEGLLEAVAAGGGSLGVDAGDTSKDAKSR